MTSSPLFTPAAFFGAMALLASFGCGLFFGGYQDTIFAPATFALLAFGLLAVLPGFWRGFRLPSSPVIWAVAAFWLFVTFSVAWSTIPFASIVTYLIALALPVTFFSLMLARGRTAWLALCGAMLMMALFVLAGWAVMQSTVLADQYYRAHDPLPNPNSLGALLNLGLIAMAPAFMMRGKLDIMGGLALAAIAVLFAGVLATESRGALFACIIALPLLLAMLGTGWRRAALLLTVLVATYGGMHVVTGGEMTRRIAEMNVPGGDENTFPSRRAIWASAADMVAEKPLTGTGLGTFYLYYPSHRQPLVDNSAGNWAHNDPLQFAVEMGVVAPVLFYLILLTAAARTWQAVPRTRRASWERAAVAAPFCALLTFAIDAHISFPFYLIPITICAGVLMAVWYDATAKALDDDGQTIIVTGWQRPAGAVLTLAFAAVIALMATSSAAGMHYLQKARAAMDRGDVENFIILANKAQDLAPPSFIDPQVMIAGLYIDMLVPPAGLLDTAEQSQVRTDALHMLDEAQSVNPAWAEIDYKRGRLYEITGVYGLTPDGERLAEDEYCKAIAKNPQHFRAREALAKRLAARGLPGDGFDVLSRGMQYPLPLAARATYIPLMQKLAGLANIQRNFRKQAQEGKSE